MEDSNNHIIENNNTHDLVDIYKEVIVLEGYTKFAKKVINIYKFDMKVYPYNHNVLIIYQDKTIY